MADERVVLDVDLRERDDPVRLADPIRRAFEGGSSTSFDRRTGFIRGAGAALADRARRRGLDDKITSPSYAYRALGISPQRQRQLGLFPGEQPGRVPPPPRRRDGPQDIFPAPARPRRRGGRREFFLGGPQQAGQIFGTGFLGSRLGLRAAGLATLGGIGAGILALDTAFNQLTRTTQILNRQFANRVEILSTFSGPLATELAQRNAALVTNRVRLAQEFGPRMLRGAQAQTEFDIALETAVTAFNAEWSPLVERFNKMGADILQLLVEVQGMKIVVGTMAILLDHHIPGLGAFAALARAWLEEDRAEFGDDFYEDQLNFFAQPTRTFRGTRRTRGARDE